MSDKPKIQLEPATEVVRKQASSLVESIKRATESATSTVSRIAAENTAKQAVERHIQELERFAPSRISPIPDLNFSMMSNFPSAEETNNYQSAEVLLRRLASSISAWRSKLTEDLQPAIVALLNSGVQMDVESLAQEGFNGIRITGRIGAHQATVFAHQATVQLLCMAQPVNPPEAPRRPIGFIINGEKSEA